MSKVMSVLARFFSTIGASLKRIFIFLFGTWHWQLPAWLRWITQRTTALGQRARANPKRSAGIATIGLLVVAAGIGGYRWYLLQPKPVQTHATLTPPTLTIWKDDKPIVAPLVIEFSDSAAPLEAIGKTVAKGITLSPKLAGTWTWENENRLVFQPVGDWPVGQKFDVDLAKKGLLATQVHLDDYQPEFTSAPFETQITESRFYQDPRDPALKKLVATVHFSHSVDAEDFEKRVQLQLAKDAGFLFDKESGIDKNATSFAITYDKQRLNAYIHSRTLTLPREDSPLRLVLAKGIHSSRGGDGTTEEIASTVIIPGRYSLRFDNIDMTLADNEKLEPEQVLLFESSAPVPDAALNGKVKAWLLPLYDPKEKAAEGQQRYPYPWYHERVDKAVLSQSEALPLQVVPGDDEQQLLHSYKFNAPVGRFIYLEIAPGVQATGGTSSAKASVSTLQVKPYPRSLKLLSQGALLKLDGERKVGFVGRAIDGVKIEVGRLLPNQLHHLVDANYGAFVQPEVSGTLMDRLVERSSENRAISSAAPGKPVYDSIDLNTYLREQTHSKLGVFLVKLSGLKRNEQRNDNPAADESPYDEYSYNDARDTRLILLTDLGLIEKHAIDGSRDVFVQSISSGAPVANARVDLIGRNGIALQSKMTTADGRVHFDNVDKFQREQTPLMVVAEREGDLSFLPLQRGDRSLNFSRFDIGGINSAVDANALSAYLFSDRGIYRPGEAVHIGSIVRTQDWKAALEGIPVEAEVTDPRGLTLLRRSLQLTRSGFQEINWSTQASEPTGTYNVALYLMKNGRRDVQLGSTTVRVQEFEPDRLKVRATLSTGEVAGWIAPEQVKAQVNAMNLFGTPAINRRVTGEITLAPAIPEFAAYPDYTFFDRTKLKEQFEDKLPDATTDDDGNATFNPGLERFDRATYRLSLLARAYEAEGGRNVAAFSAVLVSSAPHLVGIKSPQADLSYLQKGSTQRSRWLAVDPQLKSIALNDLKLEWVQRKYVSVLIKDYDGTYRYQSRLKETVRDTRPTSLAEKGSDLALPTDEPGDFALVLRDKDGAQLNRLEYSVVGQGNLSRSLERNAELQLKLDKREYAPGDSIEISIQAPYTGSGLITIERDRVYSHIWFNTTTTSSVQKIKLPADFEGGGYINVQFVRAANSDEIFTSPLSYGVLPFAVSRAQRTEAVTVTAPTLVKPGEALNLHVSTTTPSQVVVFAVDEGILQVARYKKPEPLDFFFQKRQLEVGTAQILDLILPEFQQLLLAAAAGGDADALAGRHLNPFKNKHKPPVAYWSGVVDVGPEGKTLTYNVPDYFNGRLRIFAVAVTPGSIGITETNSEVRGDLILSPNLPLMVAPGDEFDISIGVANNAKGVNGPITLQLKTSPELTVIGDSNQKLDIVSGKEGSAQYRLKATSKLGGATLTVIAGIGKANAKMEETLSVRPPVPFRTQLSAGRSDKRSLTLPLKRELYAEYRKVQATTAWSPLAWAEGLSAYLENYPYLCTEQLVSQGMPALLFTHHPELGAIKGKATVADVIQMLRTRQNGEGAFGLWAANTLVHDWPSLYAVHFLVEAREHGEAVPGDMLDNANGWLQRTAGPRGDSLVDMRKRAYAIYLLTRQGIVTTELLGTLQKEIDARYAKEWPNDLTAAYVASSYRLLQQRDLADKIIKRVPWANNTKLNTEDVYYDTLVHDAQLLYLLSKHFPQRLDSLSNAVLDNLGKQLSANTYNSLSAAYLLLAFESYSQAAQAQSGPLTLSSVDKAGKASVLNLSGDLLKRAAIGVDAKQLQFNKDSDLSSFYSVSESGFDAPAAKPVNEVKNGLEIARDYTDLKGNPLTTITVGEEFLVRLRVRAIDREQFASVAVVDLLPGGVEPVINRAPTATEETARVEDSNVESTEEAEGDYSEESDGEETPVVLPLGESQSTWHPQNADLRDDRLVLYGDLHRNAATFIYRVRATNSGKFQTPAPYVEGMYDRTQYAIGKAGALEIVKP